MSEFKPKLVEKIEYSKYCRSVYCEAHVQCVTCKRILKVRVNMNSKHLYTDEVLNNYKCFLCSSRSKKV